MKNPVRNFFQLSTLRAFGVVAASAGVTVPEPLLQGLSAAGLAVYGLWEMFRNSRKND